jgi:hypothetical protein
MAISRGLTVDGAGQVDEKGAEVGAAGNDFTDFHDWALDSFFLLSFAGTTCTDASILLGNMVSRHRR